jgi:hypothetical protein
MGNPYKVRPLRVPTPIRQTPDPCKASPPYRSGKTLASPTGVAPRLVYTQENSNRRPDGDATKTKALAT